jgi:tetratricopeptide (TPR) repeat protein
MVSVVHLIVAAFSAQYWKRKRDLRWVEPELTTGQTMRRALTAGGLFLAVLALAACQTSGSNEQRAADQLNNPTADQKNNIASISAVLAKNPRDANALNLRGTAFGQAGEYEKALADFSTAIQLNPQFYQAYNNRALIYLRVGRYDTAMSDYNQALAIKPDYAAAYVGRGNVYKEQRNFPMAIADFAKAIELKPDDPTPYYSRGLIYQAMNDHRSAVDDLTVAVNYRPDAADPHYARGISYMAVQDYKKAFDDFQVAGTNKVNNYEAWASAGRAAEYLGDRAEAAQAYRKALQINSSSEVAYQGLKRVGGDA